jgi:uncharacterized protein
MKRKQYELIIKDLEKKMVFLTGPRQVGKTRLALDIGKNYQKTIYLNYDNFEDREIIETQGWLPDTQLLIIDELHKKRKWKNYLKGIDDTKPKHLKILVTCSARLETFRKSGDSLAGRFFNHRLNPLSLAELEEKSQGKMDLLIERGGFPEPFLAEDTTQARRWRMQYLDGLIRVDILDFEKIQNLRAIELTLELLRSRVGSPLSYTSLAGDVNCSPNTIKRYIEILESLFIIFRITPHHRNIARSLTKEAKIYFYDTGMVKGNPGLCFENFVAVCLLKHLNAIEDYQGRQARLCYLRTREKKEVDFAMVVENQPVILLETKLSDNNLSKNLIYFQKKYNLPAIQLIKNLPRERIKNGIELRNALSYLPELEL